MIHGKPLCLESLFYKRGYLLVVFNQKQSHVVFPVLKSICFALKLNMRSGTLAYFGAAIPKDKRIVSANITARLPISSFLAWNLAFQWDKKLAK
jgi:hypothetical protein